MRMTNMELNGKIISKEEVTIELDDIKLFGDRVIVEMLDDKTVSSRSGIIYSGNIENPEQSPSRLAIIVKTSIDIKPDRIDVGDVIMIEAFSYRSIIIGNNNYYLVNPNDIVLKVDKK